VATMGEGAAPQGKSAEDLTMRPYEDAADGLGAWPVASC
jgi:hypothetical protein